jgi:hypothetical protein
MSTSQLPGFVPQPQATTLVTTSDGHGGNCSMAGDAHMPQVRLHQTLSPH